MVAPKFVYAKAIGQTSIRAVFDRPMRILGPDSELDAINPDVWTLDAALPAISTIIRTSLIEFELVLAEPANLGTGYTIQVADTVQSAVGEAVNPTSVLQTFDITLADLTISAINWVAPNIFDLVFSEAIQPITFQAYKDVLIIQPTNGGRQVQVSGIEQNGSTLRVRLNAAGTAGADYEVALVRDIFISEATNVVLREGDQTQLLFGQGSQPFVASASATQTSLQATFTEPLSYGTIDPTPGLPMFPGAYTTSSGSLGATVEAGATPAIVRFPEARLDLNATVDWAVARASRTVVAGTSFLAQASSVIGAGSETVAPGLTTLNKLSGAPYEVVFSGGLDTLPRTGRQVSTTLAFNFTPSGTSFPLAAFTFLNTQVSVVISKTEDNNATIRVYRGSNPLGEDSVAFNPSAPFTFSITDASSDLQGFFSVSVNNIVIAGVPSSEVLDPVLIDQNAGATAIALTLGSPLAPTQTFSATFSDDLLSQAFLTTGLRGQHSRDLLSFANSQTTVVVAASPDTNGTPGFQDTGKAAFGVGAMYMADVDAIQVIIGLNSQATIPSFTGSVSLLTGQQDVIDQIQVDESTLLVGDNEIVVVFLHPKLWFGVQVGVALDIAGSTYSVVVPVIPSSQTPVTWQLTQQPASWYHQRLPSYPANVAAYGPAVVIG